MKDDTVEVLVRIPKKKYDMLMEIGDCSLNHNERAIKHGTVLPKENGFIAICKSEKPISEDVKKSLKETVFIGDEDCDYCFGMTDIIETGGDVNGR